MPTVNFTGLASGLDTKAMIEAIMAVERKPLEVLQQRQSLFSSRNGALDELRGKLNAFEASLRDLRSESTFRGRLATVSNETILRATPAADAETGLFAVEVNALAAASKVKSDGLVAADQGLVTDGTITLQSGSNDLITIDVAAASGNNSLSAVRDAINNADAGVSAAIVFDGTDYRLSVRSTETGVDNALVVTDATNLNLDVAGNQVTSAANAAIVVDGIDVTSSSNKISGAIPGVTLDLLDTAPGTTVNVEITQDDDKVVESVQELVEKYNEIIDFFNAQNDRENPGPLAGDSTARRIQSRIQSFFTGGIEGIPIGGIRALSSIGVSFDGKTGKATLDTGELRELLDTRFGEIGNLFLSAGSASDPRVRFFSSTASTLAGDYAVQVSQAAEQATVVGSQAITSLKDDENLTIQVGSESVVVALSKNDDITDVVDTINTELRNAGIAATAADDGGLLRISTQAYGSNAQVTVTSDVSNPNNGRQTGFDTTPTTDDGLDVVGTINGVAATGNGQLLSAADGDPAGGLTLQVTATAADVATTGGDFGSISYSRGLVNTLIADVEAATRFQTGSIDVARGTIEDGIDSLNDDIARLQDRLASREARLLRAFTEAEQAISALQNQQSALSSFRIG